MSWFLVLCLIVVQCSHYGMGLDLLDPPQTIRGTVWDDWNGDGIRQSHEPGFAHAVVRLFAIPSDETNFLLDPSLTAPVDPVYFFTLSDGQYYFDCLTPGNYSIEVELQEDRPATFSPANAGGNDDMDSDITEINGRVGSTGWFVATSGGAVVIDVGAVQYAFMNLFPMTGREAIPSTPDTVLGTTYSLFDARTSTLYYRIDRGPFDEFNFEVKAGFYQGEAGHNGPLLRNMADRSSVKTNLWVLPSGTVQLLRTGKIYVLIESNGTYSDNGRLRGNYNPLYNSQNVKASLVLSGGNVVPTPVTTSATGTLNIAFDYYSDHFTYDLSLSNFGSADVNVELRGPAGVGSNGNFLMTLTEGQGMIGNVSSIPNFANNFFSGQLYALVTSSDYPSGHLRAQISGFSQTIFSTSAYQSLFGSIDSVAKIALSLDTNKHTLSYYITFEAPSSALFDLYFTIGTELKYVAVTYWKSGLWVAQGFFWNLSPEQENSILTGSGLVISVEFYGPDFGGFDEILPKNWY